MDLERKRKMKRKIIVGIAVVATVWLLITFYMYYTKREKITDTKPEKSDSGVSKLNTAFAI